MYKLTLCLILFFNSFSLLLSFNDNIDHVYLPSGMKVIMVEKPGSEKIAVGMYYNVGYHDEPLEDQGIIDIINSYIDRHGSKYFSKALICSILRCKIY